MRISALRVGYAAVLLGAGGFITVGPYGSWPIDTANLPSIMDVRSMIVAGFEVARPERRAVAAPVQPGDCTRTACGEDAVLPIVTAVTPAATVVAAAPPAADSEQIAAVVAAAVAAIRVSSAASRAGALQQGSSPQDAVQTALLAAPIPGTAPVKPVKPTKAAVAGARTGSAPGHGTHAAQNAKTKPRQVAEILKQQVPVFR